MSISALKRFTTWLPTLNADKSLFSVENAAYLYPQPENPFDLRPLLKSIMTTQNWILDRMPKGQKLVILLSEDHDTHTQILLQQAIIRQLADQREKHPDLSYAFGYEGSHNTFFKNRTNYTVADDHKTPLFLTGPVPAEREEKMIPFKSLFNACRETKTSVSLNDVATKKPAPGSKRVADFDQADPLTQSLVKKHAPQYLGKDIPRATEFLDNGIPLAEGLRLSNLMILENALRHIERTNSRIYVQHAGGNHIFGFKNKLFEAGKPYEYSDSLSALFEKQGLVVLPIIPSYQNSKSRYPTEAKRAVQDSIKADLPETKSPEHQYHAVRETINKSSNLNLI